MSSCTDTSPNYGVTSTPVIDTLTGTMYVTSTSTEDAIVVHRLHAIDITTGAEKNSGPIVTLPTIPGTGDGSSNGLLTLNPTTTQNRAALLLLNGTVYVGFGSACDHTPWHGWLVAYDATTLAQKAIYNTSPNSGLGGIFMMGGGIAADTSSNLYFTTGNGNYDGGTTFGDSVMKLSQASNGSMPILDWFTPYDENNLFTKNIDQGSGGVLILPDQPTGSPKQHLLVTAGKEGTIYLLDRDNLGKFKSGSNSQVWQSLPNANLGVWSTPTWWNNNVYIAGAPDEGLGSDYVKVYSFNTSTDLLNGTATSHSPEQFSFPDPSPVVSANGTTNGIVWLVDATAWASSGPAILRAYNATNLATEIYTSSQNLARDNPGPAVKFVVPTVINGKVYVGTDGQLSVFGQISLLGGVAVNPASLVGGASSTGTVTLSSAAPAGGISVTLSSSNPSVASVPASVPIGAGATSVTFNVTTFAVASLTPVTITATYGTTVRSTSLIVSPLLSSVTLNPASVEGGTPSTGTVTLASAAPAGGITVTLGSTSAFATVPATVVVAASQTSANFTVTTSAVLAVTTSSISGSYGGATQSATLTLNPVPVAGAVSFVRAAGGSKDGAQYTIAISPAAGHFLAVFVWSGTPPAVTDNLGNIYTQDCGLEYVQGSGVRQLTVYHLLNAPSGITGIKVTPVEWSRAIVAEYSGMPTSGAVLDVCGAVNTQTTNSTSWSSTAATTTGNDLVFGLADTGFTGAAGYKATGAWTGRLEQPDTVDADDSYLEDQVNVIPGNYTATGTTTASVQESSVVVAFKANTGPVAPIITSAQTMLRSPWERRDRSPSLRQGHPHRLSASRGHYPWA